LSPAWRNTAATLISLVDMGSNERNFSMNDFISSGVAPLLSNLYDLIALSNFFDAIGLPVESNAAMPSSRRTTEQELFAIIATTGTYRVYSH
jgi:hypothetical protein